PDGQAPAPTTGTPGLWRCSACYAPVGPDVARCPTCGAPIGRRSTREPTGSRGKKGSRLAMPVAAVALVGTVVLVGPTLLSAIRDAVGPGEPGATTASPSSATSTRPTNEPQASTPKIRVPTGPAAEVFQALRDARTARE